MSQAKRPPGSRPVEDYNRTLSGFDASMLVIGTIIGAGVFFTPHDVAQLYPDRFGIMLMWVAGGVIALAGSLVHAELGGNFPRAGGPYVFLREAFGRCPAFLYAWAIALIVSPGATAWVAGTFADSLGYFVVLNPTAKTLVAVATIMGLAGLNILGVRWGSALQNLFTGAKLCALLLMIVAGAIYAGAPASTPGADVVRDGQPAAGIGAWLAAMVPVLFSYSGFQNATFVAAEVKHPARNVPRAVISGTLVVIIVYLSINAAFLSLVEPNVMASNRSFASHAVSMALGDMGGHIVATGISVSVFGICAAILLVNPRMTQALAADGLFFRPFARLHPRFNTPWLAIVLLAVWSSVLLVVGRAEQLLNAVIFAEWLFFALVAASLFYFRRKRQDLPWPYRCHGYPWAPGFFLLVAAGMSVVCLIQADTSSRLLGPGLLAAGLPAFLWFQRRR